LARALIWILAGSLVGILIRLAGILGRTLVHILVLILPRGVGRGNLSILHIGRRSSLAPVTLLAWRWCLLRGLLCRRNQGRSQCEARAQHTGNYPSQTISTCKIHLLTPLAQVRRPICPPGHTA